VTARELARRMQARGVQLSVLGGRVRACTHLDVTSAMIDEALALLRAEIGDGYQAGCSDHH